MEEQVGALWHRWITRMAQRSAPEATVTLAEMEKTAGLLFRALGGDPGLRVVPASAQPQARDAVGWRVSPGSGIPWSRRAGIGKRCNCPDN